MISAFICGLSGERLEPQERSFLRDAVPAGIILFARNCHNREQLKRLIGDAREAIGTEEALVLIDQEGRKVRRMQPPEWRELPDARAFGAAYNKDPDYGACLAEQVARLIADDLGEVGINTNCMPLLDVPVRGAHDIIGARAFANDVDAVIALARAFTRGLEAGGVVPVGKHVPGHGRARADSHVELPVVETEREELAATDFLPFRALADQPAMMTAHVVYTAIDPDRPASTSPIVHADVIRGEIGFEGLLMSDDLGMRALDGAMASRAAAVISAGSDLALHCNGDLAEMEAVAANVPAIGSAGLRRLAKCVAVASSAADAFDRRACEAACREALALDIDDIEGENVGGCDGQRA